MAFEYLEYDLWALANSPQVNLTAAHIHSYMKQMLAAIAYMHTNKVSLFDFLGLVYASARVSARFVHLWGCAK